MKGEMTKARSRLCIQLLLKNTMKTNMGDCLQDMEVIGSGARSVRFVRFSTSPRNPESFLHFVGLDSGMFISDIVSPRSAASAAHLDLLDTLFARLEQLMAYYTPSERDFVMLRHKLVVMG